LGVVLHAKKPTAQIAHLVFAVTQCQRFKNQKSYFLPPSKKGKQFSVQ